MYTPPMYAVHKCKVLHRVIKHSTITSLRLCIHCHPVKYCTFEERAHPPDRDWTEARELAVRHLKEEERHPTKHQECKVRNEEDR